MSSDNWQGIQNTWRVSNLWTLTSRGSVQMALVRLLAVAHREKLDLLPILDAFAREHRFGWRQRLRRLVARLEQDRDLIAAAEQIPDVLADDDVLTLRFAQECGVMAPAYRLLEEKTECSSQSRTQKVWYAAIYGLVYLIFISVAFTFLMVFIVPTLKYMFEDFGLELPLLFQGLLRFSSFFPAGLLATVVVVLLVIVLIVQLLRPERAYRRYIASKVSAQAMRVRTARILELLALSLDQGRPLTPAVSTLARHHSDENIRTKLLEVRNELDHGADIWLCFASAGLLNSTEAASLEAASSDAMRSWLLRELASQRNASALKYRSAAAILAQPLLVVCFGVFVGWVSIAFFLVLISLISSLA